MTKQEPFELLLLRYSYTLKTTIGKLLLNGQFFSHSLEDVVRAEGIKIHSHTAIPAGRYKVKISYSSRFKRDMPMIYSESNGYELKVGNVSFKGIRIHGGNDHLDTEGCPCIASQKIDDDTIYGSMEKELTAQLKALGGEGFITVVNEPNQL